MTNRAVDGNPISLKLLGAIVGAMALMATPVVVWQVASSTPHRSGDPEGTLVAGAAFALGLASGIAYQLVPLLRRWPPAQGTQAQAGERRRSTLGMWGVASAAGVGLISQVLFPQVLGLDIGLVAGMLVSGLFLPGVPGFLMRVSREERARRKERSA